MALLSVIALAALAAYSEHAPAPAQPAWAQAPALSGPETEAT